MAAPVIHLVEPGAPRRGDTVYALCGEPVDRRHGLRLEPTCEACRRKNEEHDEQLSALLQEEGGL